MNYLDVFARQNWDTHMLAHQYADREKAPMHTTTEEREFSAQTSMSDLGATVAAVHNQLEAKVMNNGYIYEIPETFKIEVTRGSSVVGGYIARASATYAKIVPAAQEDDRSDDARAYDPKIDDEYYGADKAKAERLGVSIQDVKDGAS